MAVTVPNTMRLRWVASVPAGVGVAVVTGAVMPPALSVAALVISRSATSTVMRSAVSLVEITRTSSSSLVPASVAERSSNAGGTGVPTMVTVKPYRSADAWS